MINVLGHGLTYGLKLSLLFFHRVSSGNSQKKVVAFLAGFFFTSMQYWETRYVQKVIFRNVENFDKTFYMYISTI
jgi:hypothetical protein